MFREYKDYDITTTLDAYDKQKISDYKTALGSEDKLIKIGDQAFKLSAAEYIFSNQGASKTNQGFVGKPLVNKYIKNGQELVN